MSDNEIKEIAARLKAARLAAKMSQADVASKAGVSDSYYARIERGEISPTLPTYKKIATALKTTSIDIIGI